MNTERGRKNKRTIDEVHSKLPKGSIEIKLACFVVVVVVKYLYFLFYFFCMVIIVFVAIFANKNGYMLHNINKIIKAYILEFAIYEQEDVSHCK